MSNKLYDSNGRLIGEIVHISVEMGAPTKVTLDTGHTLQFDADEIACDDKYNYRIRRHGAYQNYKKGTAALHAAKTLFSTLPQPWCTGLMAPKL